MSSLVTLFRSLLVSESDRKIDRQIDSLKLQPLVGPSVDSLCHYCFPAANLYYRFPILKLPPPPCAVLLVLYTPHFTLYTLHSTLYTLHFRLYTPHFPVYTPHPTLHTLHSPLYTPHSTLYMLFRLCTLRSILYTPHFTLYNPHFTLYPRHLTL